MQKFNFKEKQNIFRREDVTSKKPKHYLNTSKYILQKHNCFLKKRQRREVFADKIVGFSVAVASQMIKIHVLMNFTTFKLTPKMLYYLNLQMKKINYERKDASKQSPIHTASQKI